MRHLIIANGLLALLMVLVGGWLYVEAQPTRLTVDEYADAICLSNDEMARSTTVTGGGVARSILLLGRRDIVFLADYAPPPEFAAFHEWRRTYTEAMLAWLEPNSPDDLDDPVADRAFDDAWVVARSDPSNPMGAWLTSEGHGDPFAGGTDESWDALVQHGCDWASVGRLP